MFHDIGSNGRGKASPADGRPSPPEILLTGGRRNLRHVTYVNGVSCELPWHQFRALLQLVAARDAGGTGIIEIHPEYVRRLRRALDEAGGSGTGERLIVTGNGPEYSLGLGPAEAGLDPTVLELGDRLKFLGAAAIERIRDRCLATAGRESTPRSSVIGE